MVFKNKIGIALLMISAASQAAAFEIITDKDTKFSFGGYIKAEGIITKEVADTALNMMEVDKLGLDNIDRMILKTIIGSFAGGPVGLDTIAASVGEESNTIEDVCEPYLLQIGFLSTTARGRCATRLAYDYLGIPFEEK